MINFITKDFISLLAAILFFGGIVLLFLVLKNLTKSKDEQEETPGTAKKPATGAVKAPGIPLSQELAFIKTQLQELNSMKSQVQELSALKNQLTEMLKTMQAQSNNVLLREELDKINGKLDSLYRMVAK